MQYTVKFFQQLRFLEHHSTLDQILKVRVHTSTDACILHCPFAIRNINMIANLDKHHKQYATDNYHYLSARWLKVKVKYVDLYSKSMQMPLTHFNMDNTVLPANNTIPVFTRTHSPGSDTMHSHYTYMHNERLNLTNYSFIDPKRMNGWVKKGKAEHLYSALHGIQTTLKHSSMAMLADIQWTVYPEEVTRHPHVMALARESLPVIDRCSNHCATPPTICSIVL